MGYVIVVDENGKREVLGDIEQYKRSVDFLPPEKDGKKLIQRELDERDKMGE